ncbi:hypothetical protein FRC08_006245 [Ceratobasidium sp. 394]|nr:hypothetical protein FRC08_006245 [Ceratobasidium sp. 394]
MPARRHAKPIQRKARRPKPYPSGASTLAAEVFNGLHLGKNLNRPSVRHVGLPASPSAKKRKALKRAKEGKVVYDLERLLLGMLTRAMDNKVILPFRMSELRRARDSTTGVRIEGGAAFSTLKNTPTVLRAADGPRLVADLDEEVIMIFLPGLIGKGLQTMIQDALNVVVARHPPSPDTKRRDRRSSAVTGEKIAVWGLENSWPNLRLGNLPPSAYYWSAGWYGTGQENVGKLGVAAPFRDALNGQEEQEVAHTQEARRIYDHVVDILIKIVHDSLAGCTRDLLNRLKREPGEVGLVSRNGWTSSFPCVAFAFNRESRKHRDTGGFRHGMDVIGVLGSFEGGRLKFQDLNMQVDWNPGCVGAFPGYDLTHEVAPWHGSHRVALISFCRSSTWRGVHMQHNVAAPTVSRMKMALDNAKAAREAAIAAAAEGPPTKNSSVSGN